MSGLRRCAKCGNLFKIQNDGPEAMQADGTFPRHVCGTCKGEDHVKKACEKAIADNPALAEQVKAGTAEIRPFVSRVMSDLKGRENPALVTAELKRLLGVM
jgi:Asp-tRNA(Asn)/Glu-tRNA(Gln) amidotransferase B subunit